MTSASGHGVADAVGTGTSCVADMAIAAPVVNKNLVFPICKS
jgi:hypothetical protein